MDSDRALTMLIEFRHDAPADPGADTAVALLSFEDSLLPDLGIGHDAQLRDRLGTVLAARRFTGSKDETLELLVPSGLGAGLWLFVGCGRRQEFSELILERAAARAYRCVETSGVGTLEFRFAPVNADAAARIAFGAQLAAYRFDKYRTQQKVKQTPSIRLLRVISDAPDASRAAFRNLSSLAEAVCLSRDLASEPANVLFPAEFARRVAQLSRPGLSVEILREEELRRLGMNALLGVGQGSEHESQLVVMRWWGGSKKEAPLGFVGKGVCFDSGGLSIKSSKSMEEMKWDMGGAAVVAGLLYALAVRNARVNVVGILGLVENMPDGGAQRPGDVIASMSGQTIEVVDTDAEGRLVLADALWYCQQQFGPRLIVDVATLTGAVEIALGQASAGLFSNDHDLAGRLLSAAALEGEGLWRLPLTADLDQQLESPVADVKNYGGAEGGAITGALFLQRFVRCPWAHLDVAGVTWWKKSSVPTVPNGATGFGVRTLNRFMAQHYESRN